MRLKLHLDCDNAAFDDAPATEIGRILRKLAERIEQEGPFYGRLKDVNGNTVGEFELEE